MRSNASRSERAFAKRTWAPDAASSWRTPMSGPAIAVARNATTSRTIGGDAQNRTGGGAFAELCLTTWLRRPERLERVAGIEPAHQPWEGRRLPLHHTRARTVRSVPRTHLRTLASP